MHGHVNLFVEGDNGPFAHRLQEALEHAGADALITRDNQTAISRLLWSAKVITMSRNTYMNSACTGRAIGSRRTRGIGLSRG
jgi:hypothetical protein